MSQATLTPDDNEFFQYLLERPGEPLVRHEDVSQVSREGIAYKDPSTLQPTTYEVSATTRIAVEPLKKHPDFSVPMQLGLNEVFSPFIPRHSELATDLIKTLMELPDRCQFGSAAAYYRDRLNPYLFNYAMHVALLHRTDTRDVPLPSMASMLPEKYFSKTVLTRAQAESKVVPAKRKPIDIPLNYTASDLDIEHRVAYFREDIGVNLHHWHWHLVYPFNGTRKLVDKDRRGELFFYMHHQMIARYNFERLCNKLHRVKRLMNFREPIVEGYFPKLDSKVAANRVWPSRPSNTTLKDVHINESQGKAIDIHIDLDHMERLKDNILNAIHTGCVVSADGKEILLTENEGIDTLGNIVEASDLSVNSNFYGNFHNMGHLLFAYCHDPDHRHLEDFGVMGDNTTAMRDPVFYRWHALIDHIFLEHKDTLPSYSEDQLNYPGVEITYVKVSSIGEREKNKLKTYWQKSNLDLKHGFTLNEGGSLNARITHLQHEPFTYKINVENKGPARLGTFRIFLAPKFDERGVPFHFKDQRHLFIELDKFVIRLEPNINTIVQDSQKSFVTIPFEQTFPNVEKDKSEQLFNICGCGWPDHMLVPMGTADGYPCQLFVMVSDFEYDKVDNLLMPETPCCKEAVSYCGLRNNKYPDKRAMGYPFDRKPSSNVDTLKRFLTRNMAIQDITICFDNRTFEKKV